MSQFDDQKDFEILDLLYGEMDEAEAESIRQKLESDPDAVERMHGWAAVRALSRHVVNEEPELSDHYAILRQARNRVSEPEPARWWHRLANLAQVPALAGLVLIVFSGGLLYSLTGQVSDESTPPLQKNILSENLPGSPVKETPRFETKKSIPASLKAAEDKMAVEDQEEIERKEEFSKRVPTPAPAEMESKPDNSPSKRMLTTKPSVSKTKAKPSQGRSESHANQGIRSRRKLRKSKRRKSKLYPSEGEYGGRKKRSRKKSSRKNTARKTKTRKKAKISKEIGGIKMPITESSSGLRLNSQSALPSGQSNARSGFAPPPPARIKDAERADDSLPRPTQAGKSRGPVAPTPRSPRTSGLENTLKSPAKSAPAGSKGSLGKRGGGGRGNVLSIRATLKRGRAAVNRGRYREAIRLYQNALKRVSNASALRDQIFLELAQAYEKVGSIREATDIYRRLSKRKSPAGRRAIKRLKSMPKSF